LAGLFGNEDEDDDEDEDENEAGMALMPWRFFQQAKTPCAFGGLEAEKIAERQAGVLEELFDIIAVGKTPSVFP